MNDRIVCIDYAKVIAMYLVIFAHLNGFFISYPINSFIYSFHMPFFFMVSGMLWRTSNSVNRDVEKSARRLLVPAAFFTIAFVVIMLPFYFFAGEGKYLSEDSGLLCHDNMFVMFFEMIIHNIRTLFLSRKMSTVTVWFLFALFYSQLTMSLLCNIRQSWKFFVLSFFCLLFVGFITFGKLPFYIGQGVFSFIFFYLGSRIDRSKLNKLKWWYSVICFLVLIVIVHFNGGGDIMNRSFGRYIFPINVLLFALSGVTGSIMLLAICVKLPRSIVIQRLSDSLISIMGFQFIFIYLYKHSVGYHNGFVITFIFSIVIFLLCYMLHYTVMCFCPILIGKKV